MQNGTQSGSMTPLRDGGEGSPAQQAGVRFRANGDPTWSYEKVSQGGEKAAAKRPEARCADGAVRTTFIRANLSPLIARGFRRYARFQDGSSGPVGDVELALPRPSLAPISGASIPCPPLKIPVRSILHTFPNRLIRHTFPIGPTRHSLPGCPIHRRGGASFPASPPAPAPGLGPPLRVRRPLPGRGPAQRIFAGREAKGRAIAGRVGGIKSVFNGINGVRERD